jgi:hypothetical protein
MTIRNIKLMLGMKSKARLNMWMKRMVGTVNNAYFRLWTNIKCDIFHIKQGKVIRNKLKVKDEKIEEKMEL